MKSVNFPLNWQITPLIDRFLSVRKGNKRGDFEKCKIKRHKTATMQRYIIFTFVDRCAESDSRKAKNRFHFSEKNILLLRIGRGNWLWKIETFFGFIELIGILACSCTLKTCQRNKNMILLSNYYCKITTFRRGKSKLRKN